MNIIPFVNVFRVFHRFWFPLAAGTIGGLIMSIIGVFIFLPVLTLKKQRLVKPKAML